MQISEVLKKIKEYTEDHYVPVIKPDTEDVLSVITGIKNPEKILELGTALGYSALVMYDAAGGNAEIDTVERDIDMVELARENIRNAGVSDRINVIFGEARDVLMCFSSVDKKYDFIFMDAAKGQYMEFFPYCYNMLNAGGVLVSDNVLYKGMIERDEISARKTVTLVRRLREYLEMLKNHNGLQTCVLDVGDGIALSYKLHKEQIQ